MQSFYDLSLTAAARQDRCDYAFTATSDAWSAMQLLARTLRSRVFRRNNGVVSIARDEWLTLPVTAFTPRNSQSMSLREQLFTADSFDGVIVEFEDRRSWKWTPISQPCPGVSLMARPLRKRIEGVTGLSHARREALFEAASMKYRRTTGRHVTELQGMLPTVLSPVRWMPELRTYGQAGDVVSWTAGTLTMGLSEPVASTLAPLYLTLLRDNGTCTTPVLVSATAGSPSIVLPAAPDFALVLNDGTRERPQYLLGPLATSDELVKVTSIGSGGQSSDGVPLMAIDVIVDDERVHSADVAFLPTVGQVQDPISDYVSGGGGGGGGNLYLVRILDHGVTATTLSGVGSTTADIVARYDLLNDGTASTAFVGSTGSGGAGLPNEWMQFGAVSTAVTALYEVRATLLSSHNPSVGTATLVGTVGGWLACNTSRAWVLTWVGPGDSNYAERVLKIEIREVASGVVQEMATITLRTEFPDPLGGA